MLGYLLICGVLRHPVATAMTAGWIAALLYLGTGPGLLSWTPTAAMIALSITVPRRLRDNAAADDLEQTQAEHQWIELQAELNARAMARNPRS